MSEVDRVTGLLEQALNRVMVSLTVNVTAELIVRTPVDTGWARSNWVPQIGGTIDEVTTDRPDRSLVPAQASRQQTGIATVAATYDLQQGAITISNGVPYILRLNEGSSSQAPAGFVQQAVIDGIRSIADEVIE